MKLTLEIPDTKAAFMLELLHNLPFVTVQADKRAHKAAQRAELMADVREAVLELNDVLAGRKEARSVYEFIKEMETDNE